MSESPDNPTAEALPVETIDNDLPCVRCGYNLRGLPTDDDCPECGMPIAYSVQGDWLRYADRQWAKQVLRGLQWTMLSRDAIGIAFCCAIIVGVVGLIVLPRDADTALEAAFEWVLDAIGIIIMILPFGIAWGLWLASAPEPRDEPAGRHTKTATRVVSVLFVPGLGVWWFVASPQLGPSGSASAAQYALATICFGIVWLHFHVILHQIEAIERRCVGSTLERLARITRFRRLAIYLPAILLLLHWIGPLRLLEYKSWKPPTGPIGCVLMTIGWLVVTGMLGTTMRLMRAELTASTPPRPEPPAEDA